ARPPTPAACTPSGRAACARLRPAAPQVAGATAGPAGRPQDGGAARRRLRVGRLAHRAVAGRRLRHAAGAEVLAASARDEGGPAPGRGEAAALLPADGVRAHRPQPLLRPVDGAEDADAGQASQAPAYFFLKRQPRPL